MFQKGRDIKKERRQIINPEWINMEYYTSYTKVSEGKNVVIVQRFMNNLN